MTQKYFEKYEFYQSYTMERGIRISTYLSKNRCKDVCHNLFSHIYKIIIEVEF